MSLKKDVENALIDILEAGGYFDKLIEAISEIEIDDPERIEETYRGGKRSKEFESLYGDVVLYMESTHYPERAAEEYYDEMSDEEYARITRSPIVNGAFMDYYNRGNSREDAMYYAVMDYLKEILHQILRDVTWEYVKKVARGVEI